MWGWLVCQVKLVQPEDRLSQGWLVLTKALYTMFKHGKNMVSPNSGSSRLVSLILKVVSLNSDWSKPVSLALRRT